MEKTGRFKQQGEYRPMSIDLSWFSEWASKFIPRNTCEN